MNIACPKTQLREALKLLKRGVEEYEKWVMELC
jgi:hypothetical protein